MTTQETQSDLEKAFQGIKLEDVSVEQSGRIAIRNPKVAEMVGQLKTQAAMAGANHGCQNQGCGTEGQNLGCTNKGCS